MMTTVSMQDLVAGMAEDFEIDEHEAFDLLDEILHDGEEHDGEEDEEK